MAGLGVGYGGIGDAQNGSEPWKEFQQPNSQDAPWQEFSEGQSHPILPGKHHSDTFGSPDYNPKLNWWQRNVEPWVVPNPEHWDPAQHSTFANIAEAPMSAVSGLFKGAGIDPAEGLLQTGAYALGGHPVGDVVSRGVKAFNDWYETYAPSPRAAEWVGAMLPSSGYSKLVGRTSSALDTVLPKAAGTLGKIANTAGQVGGAATVLTAASPTEGGLDYWDQKRRQEMQNLLIAGGVTTGLSTITGAIDARASAGERIQPKAEAIRQSTGVEPTPGQAASYHDSGSLANVDAPHAETGGAALTIDKLASRTPLSGMNTKLEAQKATITDKINNLAKTEKDELFGLSTGEATKLGADSKLTELYDQYGKPFREITKLVQEHEASNKSFGQDAGYTAPVSKFSKENTLDAYDRSIAKLRGKDPGAADALQKERDALADPRDPYGNSFSAMEGIQDELQAASKRAQTTSDPLDRAKAFARSDIAGAIRDDQTAYLDTIRPRLGAKYQAANEDWAENVAPFSLHQARTPDSYAPEAQILNPRPGEEPQMFDKMFKGDNAGKANWYHKAVGESGAQGVRAELMERLRQDPDPSGYIEAHKNFLQEFFTPEEQKNFVGLHDSIRAIGNLQPPKEPGLATMGEVGGIGGALASGHPGVAVGIAAPSGLANLYTRLATSEGGKNFLLGKGSPSMPTGPTPTEPSTRTFTRGNLGLFAPKPTEETVNPKNPASLLGENSRLITQAGDRIFNGVENKQFPNGMKSTELRDGVKEIFGEDAYNYLINNKYMSVDPTLGKTDDTAGIWHHGSGEMLIDPTMHKSYAELADTVLHEIGIHGHLRGFLGEDGMNDLRDAISHTYETNPKTKQLIDSGLKWYAEQGQELKSRFHDPFILHQEGAISFRDAARSDRVLEESLGALLRNATYTNPVKSNVVSTLAGSVMSWLKGNGFKTESLTPAHALTLVNASLEHAVKTDAPLKSQQLVDLAGNPDRFDPDLWSHMLDRSAWKTGGKAVVKPGALSDFIPKTAQGSTPNASGESSASLEAMSRLASESRNSQARFRLDTRSGKITPLLGTDEVDATPNNGEMIVMNKPNNGKQWQVLSSHPSVKTNQGDILNRYSSKLESKWKETQQ